MVANAPVGNIPLGKGGKASAAFHAATDGMCVWGTGTPGARGGTVPEGSEVHPRDVSSRVDLGAPRLISVGTRVFIEVQTLPTHVHGGCQVVALRNRSNAVFNVTASDRLLSEPAKP